MRTLSRFGQSHLLPTTELVLISAYDEETSANDQIELSDWNSGDDTSGDSDDMASSDFEEIVARHEMQQPAQLTCLDTIKPQGEPIRAVKDMHQCLQCQRKFSSLASARRHVKYSCLTLARPTPTRHPSRPLPASSSLPNFKKRRVKVLPDDEILSTPPTAGRISDHAADLFADPPTVPGRDPRDPSYLRTLQRWVDYKEWMPLLDWGAYIVPIQLHRTRTSEPSRHGGSRVGAGSDVIVDKWPTELNEYSAPTNIAVSPSPPLGAGRIRNEHDSHMLEHLCDGSATGSLQALISDLMQPISFDLIE